VLHGLLAAEEPMQINTFIDCNCQPMKLTKLLLKSVVQHCFNATFKIYCTTSDENKVLQKKHQKDVILIIISKATVYMRIQRMSYCFINLHHQFASLVGIQARAAHVISQKI
jgi:hypothetical protein